MGFSLQCSTCKPYKEGRSGGWDRIFTKEIKTIPTRNFSGNVQVLARRFFPIKLRNTGKKIMLILTFS
jgi:hypothetical protein